MRRKPSASHCVYKPPPLVYRPLSSVFLAGAQVLRISSVKLSAVAKWAADKAKALKPDIMEVEGRAVEVRTFIFEGKFPRRAEGFSGQWDVPSSGKQYTCTVRNHGGHYIGQKPTVLVAFTEYSAIDGMPLPL